jgi:hypothetical protein
MSLDRRVREGLTGAAATVTPDVEAHLARTRRRFRRRRTTQRLVLATAAVLVAVAAVPLARATLLDDRHGSLPAAPIDAEARAALRHTWQGPTLTGADVRATLADAGLAAYGTTVVIDQAYPTAWTFSLTRDGYDVQSASRVQVDTGTWSVDGRVLTLRPAQCACVLTFRWTVKDDRLRLRLLDDASPDHDGVPDEAYARAVYTSAVFTHRQP